MNFLKRENLWIWVFIALHSAIVLPLAYWLNVWLDEAWTMRTTAAHDLFITLTNSFADERQAPLYFLIITLWRNLGNSLFFVRFFSLICSIGTILLAPALAKRFLPEVSPKYVTAVIALNPYLIWASLEARGYALVILLSALLLLNWFDGYVDEAFAPKNRRRAQIFYVLCALIALWTNYYLGFLLFANACALIPLKRWKPLRTNVLQMILVGLMFLPLVFIVKQQIAVNGDYFRPPQSIIEALKGFWGYLQDFILPAGENSESLSKVRLWTVRGGIIFLMVLFFRNLRYFRWQNVMMPGLIFTVAFAFYFVAYFAVGAGYVEYRNFAPLFLPLILFFGAFLQEISTRRGWGIWLILLLIFAPLTLFFKYQPLAKNGDWRRVAQFIEQNETKNQPLATFYIYDSIPLSFTYHGKNQIFPQKITFDWNAEAEFGSPKRNARQISFLISQIPADSAGLWLITDSLCDDEKRQAECAPLENFVESHYTVEKSANFYLRKVRLLKRRN